jgi:hypothetical protein
LPLSAASDYPSHVPSANESRRVILCSLISKNKSFPQTKGTDTVAEWPNAIPCYVLSKICSGIPFGGVCSNHTSVFFFGSFIFVSVSSEDLDLKLVASAAILFCAVERHCVEFGFFGGCSLQLGCFRLFVSLFGCEAKRAKMMLVHACLHIIFSMQDSDSGFSLFFKSKYNRVSA